MAANGAGSVRVVLLVDALRSGDKGGGSASGQKAKRVLGQPGPRARPRLPPKKGKQIRYLPLLDVGPEILELLKAQLAGGVALEGASSRKTKGQLEKPASVLKNDKEEEEEEEEEQIGRGGEKRPSPQPIGPAPLRRPPPLPVQPQKGTSITATMERQVSIPNPSVFKSGSEKGRKMGCDV